MNLDLQHNMAFGDREALLVFLGDHAMAHLQYQQAMFTQKAVQIQGFDMAELGNPRDWAIFHYQIHRGINSVLALADPVDLLAFDPEDEKPWHDWLINHQYMHDATDSLLGLK